MGCLPQAYFFQTILLTVFWASHLPQKKLWLQQANTVDIFSPQSGQ
jgi:uncharacterized membrane protein required for colicin V production